MGDKTLTTTESDKIKTIVLHLINAFANNLSILTTLLQAYCYMF